MTKNCIRVCVCVCVSARTCVCWTTPLLKVKVKGRNESTFIWTVQKKYLQEDIGGQGGPRVIQDNCFILWSRCKVQKMPGSILNY